MILAIKVNHKAFVEFKLRKKRFLVHLHGLPVESELKTSLFSMNWPPHFMTRNKGGEAILTNQERSGRAGQ